MENGEGGGVAYRVSGIGDRKASQSQNTIIFPIPTIPFTLFTFYVFMFP